MQPWFGLTELIGQSGGNGVTWREKRGGQLVGIANHKSHRHGFTQCTTQAQHHTTNHAGLGIGQNDVGHDFPSGAAQTIGRLFEDGGHDLEHIAHHRGDERQDHHGQDQPGGQNTNAVEGPFEQHAHQRQLPQCGR